MVNPKSEREVLNNYFYSIREIWNDVDSLERMSRSLLEWIGEMNLDPGKYNGSWIIDPDLLAGVAYRILNKIAALSEAQNNEEMFDE